MFSRNLRFAFRQMVRQPGISAPVVVTLALAIGASTAIFSFVSALLLRPFPFRDPGQLVEIRSLRGGQPGKLSMLEAQDLKEQVSAIESMAAHAGGGGGYNFSGEGRPEEWKAVLTTGNLFEVLGVPLEVGSKWPAVFDLQRGNEIVLTYEVWKAAFGGRRDIIGTKVVLDHAPGYVIRGVSKRGFDFPRGTQVYRSLGGFASYSKRDDRNVVVIARLKTGVPQSQLRNELAAVSTRLARRFPGTNASIGFQAIAFRDQYTGDVKPYLLVLLGAVGFVLLIGCGNVVNLLLSRAIGREREMAIRTALGAARRDLLSQLLTESVVLSLIAAGAGWLLAFWWVKVLRAMIGFELPAWMSIELDGTVLAFTICVALAAGIIAGLAPALRAASTAAGESLKDSSRGSSGSRSSMRLRDLMVVLEIALAVVLLAGAGALIRGFLNLENGEKGFRTESIQTFRVALGWKRYIDLSSTARYYERALTDLANVPGLTAVAFSSNPPLSRQEEGVPTTVLAEGQSAQDALRNPYVDQETVSENYFDTLKIPIRRGRAFNRFDSTGGEPVAIVSERLARSLWPDGGAVSRRILVNPAARGPAVYRKVVGVTGDVQHGALGGESSFTLYLSYRQHLQANQYVLVKSNLPAAAFAAHVEKVMWGIDPQQSIFDFRKYDTRILDSIWQLRISRVLLTIFGVVALLLAALGIFSVMSFLVGQRRREIGIRLALGAQPAGILIMVVRRGMIMAMTGLLAGLFGAYWLSRILASLLRGVSGLDWLSAAACLTLMLAVTAAACAIPAWRGARIDPASALRLD